MSKKLEFINIENKYFINQYFYRYKILENEFEPNGNRIPTWFNINYEDIDGNDLYQTFELKSFEDTVYYSLVGTYDV